MKSTLKSLLAITLLFTALSCSKDDGYVDTLTEADLTQCPENSNCQYLYANNADFSGNYGELSNGSYRVFYNEIRTSYRSTLVSLKAPMKGETFFIDNSAIQKGVVKFDYSCPACNYAAPNYKVTGGYSKGKKLNTSGNERWLVETKLFFADGTDFKDTVYVKQYYYPKP